MLVRGQLEWSAVNDTRNVAFRPQRRSGEGDFQSDSVDDLRDVITVLRNDRMLLRNRAELAYQRARRHFNADSMVDEYVDVYQTLSAKRLMAA